MMIRRSLTFLAVALLTACGDPSSPEDDVAEVRIAPTSPSVDVGLTVQFTATVLNAEGAPISGLTVNWTSSTPATASIDGTSGLATAHAVGTTAITATVGGASDSEVLTVQPSACTDRIDVVLSAGQFQSYPADECLFLPTGSSGDRYRVAVYRPTLIQDAADVPNVTLEIDPILSTTAATAVAPPQAAGPAPQTTASVLDAALPKLDGTRIVDDLRVKRATSRFHYELRERERALGLDRFEPLPDRPLLAPPALVDPPSRADLYLDLTCSATATRPAILIDFNDDIAIYQDSVSWDSDPLPTTATGQMLNYYSAYVLDMIGQYWGPPSDIDGNQRVHVVTTPDLSEEAAAAVFSGDFLAPTSCGASNQGEFIYFQRDIIANLVDVDPSYSALSIMAHEVKHVVSLYNGIRRGSFHNTWIEEGTAEVSQVMSSRIAWAASGGPALGEVIDGNAILDYVRDNGGDITPEMWGVISEIADLIVQMSLQPNSLVTNPNGANDFHNYYAASWHLHRLIGDAWGDASTPRADSALFREQNDSLSPAGPGGLAVVTGRTFSQLFDDLIVATSVHQTAQSATREFTTWDFVTATDIFVSPPEVAPEGVYPWPVTGDDASPNAPFTTNSFSSAMGPSGIRYHDFLSNGTGAGAQIQVTGAGTSGKIMVVRLR